MVSIDRYGPHKQKLFGGAPVTYRYIGVPRAKHLRTTDLNIYGTTHFWHKKEGKQLPHFIAGSLFQIYLKSKPGASV